MSCCVSKRDFLLSKARNFRDFISKYEPADEIVRYMSSFQEETLIATLLGVVVPIVQTKTTQSAVDDLIKKLKVPETDVPEVRAKIQRYLEMFASVVVS